MQKILCNILNIASSPPPENLYGEKGWISFFFFFQEYLTFSFFGNVKEWFLDSDWIKFREVKKQKHAGSRFLFQLPLPSSFSSIFFYSSFLYFIILLLRRDAQKKGFRGKIFRICKWTKEPARDRQTDRKKLFYFFLGIDKAIRKTLRVFQKKITWCQRNMLIEC